MTESLLNLAEIFGADSVTCIASEHSKFEVLDGMLQSLVDSGRLAPTSVPRISQGLREREELGTSALGRGIALPHLRTRSVVEFLGVVGVAHAGIDFGSLDGSPTRLVVLLLSPYDRREAHGLIMGRLATLLTDRTLQYSLQLPRTPAELFRFLGF